jgi:hypothetical protein
MRSWFGRRAVTADGVDSAEPLEAYKNGRRDELHRVERDGTVATVGKADVDRAYNRGRADERQRHRGSPLLTLLVLVAVLIGAGLIYLAVRNGSFSQGGAVVDQSLSSAQAPLRGAAAKAGDALQNAGQNLKQDAGVSKDKPASNP